MTSASDAYLLNNLLVTGSILVAVGTMGFVVRRHGIFSLLSVAIMFQGAALASTGFSAFYQSWSGQLLALFALSVSSCQIVLVLAIFRKRSE